MAPEGISSQNTGLLSDPVNKLGIISSVAKTFLKLLKILVISSVESQLIPVLKSQ